MNNYGTTNNYFQKGNSSKTNKMRLYTEEQVKDMLNGAMFEHHIVDFLNTYYTPIELPSDEEIEKASSNTAIISSQKAFIRGCKWMRDKILNK